MRAMYAINIKTNVRGRMWELGGKSFHKMDQKDRTNELLDKISPKSSLQIWTNSNQLYYFVNDLNGYSKQL